MPIGRRRRHQDPRRLGKERNSFSIFLVSRLSAPPPSVRHCLQAGGHDGEPGSVEGLADGGELGDDVLAVAALLEHADDAAELSLRRDEPVDDRGHVVGSSACRFSSVGQAGQAVRGRACSRRRGVVGHGLQGGVAGQGSPWSGVDGFDDRGAVARLCGRRRCTGSSSPMDGSACSAAWASGGLQAPRMTCGARPRPAWPSGWPACRSR